MHHIGQQLVINKEDSPHISDASGHKMTESLKVNDRTLPLLSLTLNLAHYLTTARSNVFAP